MKYETLGSSSLQISRIVHGCMELGGGPWDVRTDAENAALLRAALEHGVTAFDTAESYGGGHSEEVVGAALAPVPRRLSASCGTCVRYEAEDACLACMDADVDRVYAADGADGYELLYENRA